MFQPSTQLRIVWLLVAVLVVGVQQGSAKCISLKITVEGEIAGPPKGLTVRVEVPSKTKGDPVTHVRQSYSIAGTHFRVIAWFNTTSNVIRKETCDRDPAVVIVKLMNGAQHQRAAVASDPYSGSPKYSLVRRFVETPDWNGVIATLKASGLRGMGGAGFPTGSKWEIVRNAPGKEKYIVCNADESEPGTIKDRFIMENVPYLVIEGMIMAGLVTGARRGILYIRHEYERPKEILQEEIDRDVHLRLRERHCGRGPATFHAALPNRAASHGDHLRTD